MTRKPLVTSDGTQLYPLRHKDGKWRGLAVVNDQVMATGPACDTEEACWDSCEFVRAAFELRLSNGGRA